MSSNSLNNYLNQWDRQIPIDQCNRTLSELTKLPSGYIKFGYQWVDTLPLKNLFLYGIWGSGKTSFSCSLIRHFLISVFQKGDFPFPRYVFSRDLDSCLLEAIKKGTDLYELEKWCSPLILLIDDIDKVTATESFKIRFFDLLKKRIEQKKVTIITSNYNPTELSHLLDGALLSRMEDKSSWQLIEFPDKDLRKLNLEANTIRFTNEGQYTIER